MPHSQKAEHIWKQQLWKRRFWKQQLQFSPAADVPGEMRHVR
jgi:hypothetical protein